MFVWRNINIHSPCLWVQTVLIFSTTCFFIRMRQTSYRTFQELIKRKLARSFDFTFCYTYDVLWLNNSKFGNCNDCIFPIEHEIKDTTDTSGTLIVNCNYFLLNVILFLFFLFFLFFVIVLSNEKITMWINCILWFCIDYTAHCVRFDWQ
jgi:predicted PurR-regulated permease PerM